MKDNAALWFVVAASIVAGCLSAPATADHNTETAGRNFYVDAAEGNDQDDGLAPERAWQSLERVNRAELAPGDSVLFRRGHSWRGQLIPQSGAAGAPITYGAYGEGDKPLLLGSAPANRSGDWQPAGSELWATAAVAFELSERVDELGSRRWSRHQEGGAECAVEHVAPPSENRPPADSTGQGETDSGGGGAAETPWYRLSCSHEGTRRNHIQFSASGIRVVDSNHYVLRFRARCSKPFTPGAIAVMKSVPPWTGYARPVVALPEIGCDWQQYEVGFRADHTADDARITFFLGAALPAGATLELQPLDFSPATCNQPIPLSVDVGNIIFDHGAKTGVKKWCVDDLKQDGDYYYDPQRWRVVLRSETNPATCYKSIELALRRHIIDQGNRGYVTYENLALRYGAAHGIGGGNTHHITVRNCDVSYIGGGHQLTRPDGRPVRFGNGIEFWSEARHCLVEGCRLWEIYDAALTNQGKGTNVQDDIVYRNNVVWNCEYSFEYWNRDDDSRTRNIRFEQNTCVNAGQGWGHAQRPDRNGRHVMFYYNSAATETFVVRRNIFCNATESLLRLHGRDWTSALAMEENLWYQPDGPGLRWMEHDVPAEAMLDFLHQRHLGRSSLLADPRFVAPERHDYRLQAESPARQIDAGATIEAGW